MAVLSVPKVLSRDEIIRLSSKYLSSRIKQDLWQLDEVTVEGHALRAKVSMSSFYTSPDDLVGFHLSQLTALEFLSQLKIILVHVLSGHTEKIQEGWMIDTNINCKKAIRNPHNIQVLMEATALRKIKNSVLITTRCRVFDEKGLFTADLKGLLS